MPPIAILLFGHFGSEPFVLLSSSITKLPIYQISSWTLKTYLPQWFLNLSQWLRTTSPAAARSTRRRPFPLTDAQRTDMQPFFSPAVFDSARLCVLRGTRVSNPSMYPMAKMMGIRNLPDFAAMIAITFVDVIVSHEEFTDACSSMNSSTWCSTRRWIKEFAGRFVNGFIQGGSYEEVPLEKMAHELESRFSQNAAETFSVDDEVRQWRKRKRFKALLILVWLVATAPRLGLAEL